MSARLPTVRITPEDVMAFAKKRGQNPSIEDAQSWHGRRRRDLQSMMRDEVELRLEQMLSEACLSEYPDPIFNAQYQLIDQALMDAGDLYAEKLGCVLHPSSDNEADMLAVTRRMLTQESFRACIAYDYDFAESEGWDANADVTHSTHRAHVFKENGTVTAEVIADVACSHSEQDFFIPERVRSLQ